jgi:hypothetical protein
MRGKRLLPPAKVGSSPVNELMKTCFRLDIPSKRLKCSKSFEFQEEY